jgi:hypothetical protein
MFLALGAVENIPSSTTERKRKRCDTFEQDVKQEDD